MTADPPSDATADATPPGRWFVAAFPPPEAVAVLEALPRPAEPGVRWVPPDRWHVTLRFLGGLTLAHAASAVAALETAELPIARAEVRGRLGRLGRSALVLPVDGLDGLATAVERATAAVEGATPPTAFRGHLTIGRLDGRGVCGLSGRAVRTDFEVSEVVLIRSGGPDGPGYHIVARRACAPS